MFKLTNIMSDKKVVYEYKNNEVDFTTEKLLKGRILTKTDPEKLFLILNEYIKSKGEDFASKLYDRLVESKDIITMNAIRPSIEPLPLSAIHGVLDMFDYQDVKDFVVKSPLVKVPSVLKEKFDETIVINEEGSREQTYTIDDYYNLITLITILKATLGPIGYYKTIRSSLLPSTHADYILLNFYLTHPISETPAFQKLMAYVNKLIAVAEMNPNDFSVHIIEKNTSIEEMPYLILGQLIFNNIIVADEFQTDTSNIITKLYNFIRSRIRLKNTDATSKIKLKTFGYGANESDHESESIIESYRTPTDITVGSQVEFEFVFSDPIRLAKWVGVKNLDLVKSLLPYMYELKNTTIPVENIKIMSWYVKRAVDPRSVDYVSIDGILNGLTVAAAWLIENGFQDLGIILTCYHIDVDAVTFTSTSKRKIRDDVKEKLNEVFMYQKRLHKQNQETLVNYVEEIIINITNKLHKYKLFTIVPVSMHEEIFGKTYDEVELDPDIRNIMALSLIKINTED